MYRDRSHDLITPWPLSRLPDIFTVLSNMSVYYDEMRERELVWGVDCVLVA